MDHRATGRFTSTPHKQKYMTHGCAAWRNRDGRVLR